MFPTLLITIHDIANLKTFIDYLGMTLTYIRSYVDNEVTCTCIWLEWKIEKMGFMNKRMQTIKFFFFKCCFVRSYCKNFHIRYVSWPSAPQTQHCGNKMEQLKRQYTLPEWFTDFFCPSQHHQPYALTAYVYSFQGLWH